MTTKNQTELVVSEDRIESMLPLLGAELTDEGFIRDIESGTIATTPDGEQITVDEVGYLGVADAEDETIELVRDDVSSIISYLSENDHWDDPRETEHQNN